MRWVLFDLVVGAALVWLVWDAGTADQPVAWTPPTAANAPPPPPPPRGADAPPVAPPVDTAVAEPPAGVTGPAPPADRGRRLRALARDAESLFLRGRE